MKARRLAVLSWLFLAPLTACNSSSNKQLTIPVETYSPADGAVGMEILRMGTTGTEQRWLTTYTDGARTTRFTVELEPAATSGDPGAPSLGKGKFVSEPGSDPLPLLESLKKALNAKHLPGTIQKSDELAFSYLLVGEHQSRLPSGSFRTSPGGDWQVMKIFLANDRAQVYFNLNPVIHKAEFLIKDAEYGDTVLAELAKVF